MPREFTEEEIKIEPEPIPASVVQQEQPRQLNLADLRVGYVVGLDNNNGFVFEVLGSDAGLIELFGLQEYAENQIKRLYENKQIGGDRLVHEVGKAVALINQKLDKLITALSPNRPINKLG